MTGGGGQRRLPPGAEGADPALGEGPASSGAARASVRGSTALLAGRLLSMVFTVTTQVLLVRALSKGEYGAFAYALALTSASRNLLSLGQGRAMSRFVSLYDEEGDERRLVGTFALAVLTVLGASLLLLAGLLVGREAVAGTLADEPQALSILLVLVALAPLEALDEAFVGLFAALSKVRTILLRRYLLTPGLRLLVVVVVLLLDGGALLVAAGYVAASVVGIGFYATFLRRVLRARPAGPVPLRRLVLPWRTVVPFALPLLTTELVYLSMSTGSVLLLAAERGAEAVAEYRAVFPAARLNQLVYASFATLFVPTVARMVARGDRQATRDAYWHTAVLLTVLSFPVFALTGPFAQTTTVALFGERYAASGPALLLLSAGFYLGVCLGLNMQTLQVVGRVRLLLGVNVVVAVLNLVLSLLLVEPYGGTGVAAANALSMVVQNLLLQLGMRDAAGVLPDRATVRPYLLAGALLGLLVAVQAVASPPFWAAFLLSAAASLVLLVGSRRVLRLADTFPELGRLPVVRRLVSP